MKEAPPCATSLEAWPGGRRQLECPPPTARANA